MAAFSPRSSSSRSSSGRDDEPRDAQVEALKIPPHSIESEQSTLGGLLLDNGAWDKIGDVLREDDFYRADHRLIWKHISQLIEKGRPADVITVYESLDAESRAEEAGGLSYLNALAQNTPSAANIKRYADIVRERSVLRKLLGATGDIADSIFNREGREVREILDSAESAVFQIAEDGARGKQGFEDLASLLVQVRDRVQELHDANSPDITGLETGFKDLDMKTSGLQPGDLVIVAGRPSMGKTAFSLNIAENVALAGGIVGVFSMEMGGTQLAMRMLGSIGQLDLHRLRTGKLDDHEFSKFATAFERLSEAKLHVDETPALTALELRARARRLHRIYGKLDLIVIDYLQLMSGSSNGREENRATEVSEISRSLKALAKELHCPVIALSQLNRGLEQRQDKRPMMSDLRESGAIEQDADVILFIYRDEVYHPDAENNKGLAEVIIGKQRNGPIGKVELTFLGQYTKFANRAYPGSF
ncbi:MAG TPA: replicative DNA helicase [Burkholderiales bacterium]|nr:replicative DNA helicase [Burkholderiales bacterium]